MKIAIICDTHFGWKNDSPVFHKYFTKFFDEIFFPTLDERGIKTIAHGGDIFDRRKFINFSTLHLTRQNFLDRLINYDTHLLVGNHDCYYRDSNNVNSVRELCYAGYPFRIYEEPEEVTIGGLKMLFLPWMNPTNTPSALDLINRSRCHTVIGHLELAGFHFDRNTLCEHGLDRKLFKRFKNVFSGHFHTQSHDGNIRYLGAPYQMTFADYKDERGFHIFDTETFELEFIKNPFEMFHKLTYDDSDPTAHQALLAEDLSIYNQTQVRLSVNCKNDPYLYDRWLTKLEEEGPDNLQIVETFSLGVDETADEQFGNFESGDVITSDTITILNSYVDNITGVGLDKGRLKRIMGQLYTEAVHIGAE